MRTGWRLVQQSWSLLRQDKELAVLPLGGFLLSALVWVGLVAAIYRRVPTAEEMRPPKFFLMYPLFIVGGIPMSFANAAVIGATCQRLSGGDPTVRSALAAAWERRWRLLAWTLVGGAIGMVLQVVLERLKVGGWLAARLLGLAWQLATMFVVPVLMFEDEQTVRGAVSRSAALFKQRWGESVSGQGAMLGVWAVASLVVTFVTTIAGLVLFAISPVLGAIVMIGGMVVFLLAALGFGQALFGVYQAALYHFAVTGEGAGPFTVADLHGAYRPRPEKQGWRRIFRR
jgi:MFS family permease